MVKILPAEADDTPRTWASRDATSVSGEDGSTCSGAAEPGRHDESPPPEPALTAGESTAKRSPGTQLRTASAHCTRRKPTHSNEDPAQPKLET